MSQNEEYQKRLRELWKRILSMPKEQRERIINSLNEQTLIDLRSLSNIFNKPVVSSVPKGKIRTLAFNVINLREKYCQRFAMTSLIAFVFRMLDEYIPPEAEKYISENDPKFANIFNKKKEIAEREIPKKKLDNAIGYHIFYLKEDRKTTLASITIHSNKIGAYQGEIKINEEALQNIENKYSQKVYHDFKKGKLKELTETQKIYFDKYKEPEKNPIQDYNLPKEKRQKKLDEEGKKRAQSILTISDLNNPYSVYEQQIKNIKNTITIIQEKIEDSKKKKEELEQQLKSIDAELSLYANQKYEEERYQLTDDEEEELINETKKELNITMTAEDYTAQVQEHIEKFLLSHFQYNPDEHVKSAYSNYLNKKSKKTPNVIPPSDTFHRWNRYINANYEYLRQATDDIYVERSELEFAIAPLEIFEGTEEEVKKKFDDYKRKYCDEFDADVYCALFNNWTFLSSWEKNRENSDFYNEKTEIIRRIIEQHKDDERMGAKLVKKRSKKKKAVNPGLEQYIEANEVKDKLEKYGAKRESEIDIKDFIPEDKHEASEKEVEVGVHLIKPSFRKRKIRGITKQWHFNIPVKPPKEGEMQVKTPDEVWKEIEKEK
ncbi:MAG: hypothetical protein QW303_02030 [Nitrososphaerota archaeon]